MATTESEHARLATVVEEVLTGFSGVDLEEIDITPVGRRNVVRVTVDRDGGIDLDLVADISSAISGKLDATPDLLSGAYVLEVSSPGVDRPLTKPRHWHRARTRLVATSLRDGSAVTGRVISADDNAALIMDGAGVEHAVRFADVVSALVQVEFNRAGEVDPNESHPVEDDGEGGA